MEAWYHFKTISSKTTLCAVALILSLPESDSLEFPPSVPFFEADFGAATSTSPRKAPASMSLRNSLKYSGEKTQKVLHVGYDSYMSR